MKDTPVSLLRKLARSVKKGFTLVEVLAVVAIIAILATLTLNISKGVSSRQAQARVQGDMSAIAGGLEAYKAAYGDYLLFRNTTSATADLRTSTDFERYLVRALMGDWYVILPPGGGSVITPGASNSNSAATNPERRAFVDPAVFRYSSGTNLYNASNASLSIVDPWNNPYIYRYKNGFTYNSTNKAWYCSWLRPGFLLMSMGPDATLTEARTVLVNLPTAQGFNMQLTGVIPSTYSSGTAKADTYRFDNIIYGEKQ